MKITHQMSIGYYSTKFDLTVDEGLTTLVQTHNSSGSQLDEPVTIFEGISVPDYVWAAILASTVRSNVRYDR